MIVTVDARQSQVRNAAGLPPVQEWYFEIDDGREVIFSDGFFPTRELAIIEGHEWADANGHTFRP